MATQSKEVTTTLGDRQVFVRHDEKGVMQCVKGKVELSMASGEIAIIQDKPIITVTGYHKLNQVASVNILTPPTCIIDGKEQSNPYIERNPQTRVIETITVRKIALGYSPIGNMVAIDKTLFFNIYTYFLQDLQAKIKKHPASGCLGVRDTKPLKTSYTIQEWKTTPEGKKYPKDGETKEVNLQGKPMAFYPIQEPVGIWVDISHPEIQEAFNAHTQRQKFGDRHAQSICERNALKSHPAIAKTQVALNKATNTAEVEVFGWRHTKNFNDLNKMTQDVNKGSISEMESATYEDVQEVEVTEITEEGQTIQQAEPEEQPLQNEPLESVENQNIDNDIEFGISVLGNENVQEILKKSFRVTTISKLSEINKTNFLKLINAAIDEKNKKEGK